MVVLYCFWVDFVFGGFGCLRFEFGYILIVRVVEILGFLDFLGWGIERVVCLLDLGSLFCKFDIVFVCI